MQFNKTATARFWAKVLRGEGCWEWSGSLSKDGYGQFVTNGRGSLAGAHRVSYTMTHGPIPDGMLVCHSCDNPRCVRPDHLWLGSYSDNLRDAYKKGRHPKVGNPKITQDQALAIRSGTSRADDRRLAAMFGIQPLQAYMIRTGRHWKHLAEVGQ